MAPVVVLLPGVIGFIGFVMSGYFSYSRILDEFPPVTFMVRDITGYHFCFAAPVVSGTGPNFSLGELQGHLAYDLNPAGTGMRRTLPSTSSSGYVIWCVCLVVYVQK